MAALSEQLMSVPTKWRSMSQVIVHRGPSAGEPVRPREMGVLSYGGEEAVAPRVPPVPAKPTQAEQDEHYATGHAAYRSWCEHCVKRLHTWMFLKESCLKLESTLLIWDQKDPK